MKWYHFFLHAVLALEVGCSECSAAVISDGSFVYVISYGLLRETDREMAS